MLRLPRKSASKLTNSICSSELSSDGKIMASGSGGGPLARLVTWVARNKGRNGAIAP